MINRCTILTLVSALFWFNTNVAAQRLTYEQYIRKYYTSPWKPIPYWTVWSCWWYWGRGSYCRIHLFRSLETWWIQTRSFVRLSPLDEKTRTWSWSPMKRLLGTRATCFWHGIAEECLRNRGIISIVTLSRLNFSRLCHSVRPRHSMYWMVCSNCKSSSLDCFLLGLIAIWIELLQTFSRWGDYLNATVGKEERSSSFAPVGFGLFFCFGQKSRKKYSSIHSSMKRKSPVFFLVAFWFSRTKLQEGSANMIVWKHTFVSIEAIGWQYNISYNRPESGWLGCQVALKKGQRGPLWQLTYHGKKSPLH